jgi:hypothetical protein
MKEDDERRIISTVIKLRMTASGRSSGHTFPEWHAQEDPITRSWWLHVNYKPDRCGQRYTSLIYQRKSKDWFCRTPLKPQDCLKASSALRPYYFRAEFLEWIASSGPKEWWTWLEKKIRSRPRANIFVRMALLTFDSLTDLSPRFCPDDGANSWPLGPLHTLSIHWIGVDWALMTAALYILVVEISKGMG